MEHSFTRQHPLWGAVREFADADRAYQQMKGLTVGDFEAYEHAWRELLRRTERVWTKTLSVSRGRPGWQQIEAEVSHLRRTDALLSYIQQARHADEHSIQQLATDWDAQVTAVPTSATTATISWQPFDRPLLPVKNRGVVYPPPRDHLGVSFEDELSKGQPEPAVVAAKALVFYSQFLNQVSHAIFPGRR